jgi:hypothetical protein
MVRRKVLISLLYVYLVLLEHIHVLQVCLKINKYKQVLVLD